MVLTPSEVIALKGTRVSSSQLPRMTKRSENLKKYLLPKFDQSNKNRQLDFVRAFEKALLNFVIPTCHYLKAFLLSITISDRAWEKKKERSERSFRGNILELSSLEQGLTFSSGLLRSTRFLRKSFCLQSKRGLRFCRI